MKRLLLGCGCWGLLVTAAWAQETAPPPGQSSVFQREYIACQNRVIGLLVEADHLSQEVQQCQALAGKPPPAPPPPAAESPAPPAPPPAVPEEGAR